VSAAVLRSRRSGGTAAPLTTKRVAIYTRKSTEEGLDQEFNSLDAQRQAVEAYIQSQRGQGWAALPERYDDGGFTGANTARPAFQRLLNEVNAGSVDVIAVYKIDRLSRSLLDFTQLMRLFEEKGVEFVSVTQQFSTSTSVGRMTLNLLATFAQFERETISERTRDKIAATRRRGLWTGGRPVLGYDVVDKKLVVNPSEAERVRTIYGLYGECGSVQQVLDEMRRRGWTNKTWKNKAGKHVHGKAFDKFSLRRLLTNPLYRGRIPLGREAYDGAHEAIVDAATWEAVQGKLKTPARDGAVAARNKWSVLLKGLVRCGVCGAAMTHQYASRGCRRYSYYVCSKQQKEGAAACPRSRIAVGKLDSFVVERIRAIGCDPDLVAQAVRATRRGHEQRRTEVTAELRYVDLERRRIVGERKNLVTAIADGGAGTGSLVQRLGELDALLADVATRGDQLRANLIATQTDTVDEADLRAALGSFVPVWDQLFPCERARMLGLILAGVSFDARTLEVNVTFRPSGLRAFKSNTGAAP